jgi:predicted O-methyltransferase YrrM
MRSRNQLPTLFQAYNRNGLGAEVGVEEGFFSSKIISTWKGHLFCIDTWPDLGTYERCTKRLQSARVSLIKAESLVAAEQFVDASFDWVYIDAAHDYLSIRADLAAWWPKIRAGGILSGHDYLNGDHAGIDFGVQTAVDEFVSQKGLSLHVTTDDFWKGRPFQSWLIVK